MKPELGVCYYPEHWPEERWVKDAQQMVESGLSWVRIGEFAWSKLEPTPGDLHFEWLDRAVEVLGQAGLKVVMGTPTATPPRWMLDQHPDMLAVDETGRPRKFGSRRHYCFSHAGYREEAVRIARLMAQRYGANPTIGAWQIDNEYGCHDTVISYSQAAEAEFRIWLRQKYGTIEALNGAWGNVFWSMEYNSFDQIDLPNLTVTDPNPAHVLAFRRFSSGQVVAFNRAQAEAVRQNTDAPLIHNYMGRILEFDHFEVGADLDIASWDSYPIGFLSDRLEASADHKLAYLQQGDPDMQAFHHDLYRAVGKGRWWIMEQQPGPVNWAPHNPAPLPGMVKLWSLEAVAHGAEVVSYFRWRQAPFGQEQMHAGLLSPEGNSAPGLAEVQEVSRILKQLGTIETVQADVALVFDYPSDWAWKTLPQGEGFDYFRVVFAAYRALRRAGLSVDFVNAASGEIDGYKLVFASALARVPDELQQALNGFSGVAIIGPRSGAVTEELSIPDQGRPAVDGIECRVDLVETFPPNASRNVQGGGQVEIWRETLSGPGEVLFEDENGAPVMMGHGQLYYLAGLPDDGFWDRIIHRTAQTAGLKTVVLPDGLRCRQAGQHRFWVNYSAQPVIWNGQEIPACGVVIEEAAPKV